MLAVFALVPLGLLRGAAPTSTATFAAGNTRGAVVRRQRLLSARMPDEEQQTPIMEGTIFTMEERGDGWDDVRKSIKASIRDREKAWNQIDESYVKPFRRWSVVLTTEVKQALEETPYSDAAVLKPDLKPAFEPASKSEASAPTAPLKEKADVTSLASQAIGVVASLVDMAAKRRKKTSVQTKVEPRDKPASDAPLGVGISNVLLLLGVPFTTLSMIYFSVLG